MKKVLSLGIVLLISLFLLASTACAAAGPQTKMAYIVKSYAANGKQYLAVDWIKWVGIKEAKADPAIWKAATKAGAVQHDETGDYFDDDYYIYNPDKTPQKLQLAKNVKISLCDFNSSNPAEHSKLVSLKDLQKKIKTEGYEDTTFNVTVSKNIITAVSEQYRP